MTNIMNCIVPCTSRLLTSGGGAMMSASKVRVGDTLIDARGIQRPVIRVTMLDEQVKCLRARIRLYHLLQDIPLTNSIQVNELGTWVYASNARARVHKRDLSVALPKTDVEWTLPEKTPHRSPYDFGFLLGATLTSGTCEADEESVSFFVNKNTMCPLLQSLDMHFKDTPTMTYFNISHGKLTVKSKSLAKLFAPVIRKRTLDTTVLCTDTEFMRGLSTGISSSEPIFFNTSIFEILLWCENGLKMAHALPLEYEEASMDRAVDAMEIETLTDAKFTSVITGMIAMSSIRV